MVIVLRTTDDVLRWAGRMVDPPLRAAIGRLPEPSREVGELQLGHPAGCDAPAAWLRSALTLVCAAAVGGDPHDAVPAAVAVELMHHWSAIRRDLVDGRADGAAWSVVGSQPAALGGEALLALAFDVVATGDPTHTAPGRPRQRTGAPGPDRAMMRVLGDTVQELLHGQHASLALRETRPDPAEERTDLLRDVLAMVEQRTGALFGCACALGAVAGGGDADQVERLRLFGVRLGLAVQFAEDLLGIWGEHAGPGRPAYADLRRRRRSLPVAAALAAGADELAGLFDGRGRLSDADAERAAKTIEQSGARDWCRRQAEELLSQALLALDLASPAPAAVAELVALARRAAAAPN
ncbi:polyprenyl synthetase family protein [Dactylosporangium salmoneum]|uniref:Family 2 encapsulin nanocompartment cargo protein polyprenyl transferase n=1 Tax=Dactylosporangium salmoneum TaxID=53361 RepID=A0ABN3GMI0_9ACTN